MSSSISASEDAAWRRLLALYAVSALVLAVTVGAVLLTLDPYDTGRFALFPSSGVPQFGQRLTAASVARRADADTAIIGNSTLQLLDPARLGAASGRRVVSLAIPGTGPLEQLAVADWFLGHHQGTARGVVIGIDDSWCRADGRLELTNPFPFWLYAPSPLVYAANLLRLKSFDAAARKLRLMLGRERPARADGYNDYEAGRAWDAAATRRRLAQEAQGEAIVVDAGAAPDFAALPLLRRWLARVPAGVRTVLVFPPRYRDDESEAGGSRALRQACREAFTAVAQAMARTALVDFLARGDIAARVDDFWDTIHYRAPVAREIEAATAAALRAVD